MKSRLLHQCVLLCAFFLGTNATRAQTLGGAFHVPDSTEVGGTHMRNPEFEVGTNTTVTVYNGNQYQNGTNPGNQTGGYVFYRGSDPIHLEKCHACNTTV